MVKTLYHATPYSNFGSILTHGLEPRNIEKVVYFCESPQDCLKFAALHGARDILVLRVKLSDEEVFETFDHNEDFFQCRCFGCSRVISEEEIESYIRFSL